MVKIYVGKDGTLDEAWRTFSKFVKSANILFDYNKHEYYMNKNEKQKFKEKFGGKKKKVIKK